jgi:IclR family KDG regulon transcriptional repressor
MNSKESLYVQTVSRAILLLRCLEEGRISLSLAELTRRTGLNKSTVYRLAETLLAEGVLDKNSDTAVYSISYGLISLGRALLDPSGLSSRVQPILREIQQATDETAMINLRDGLQAVVISEVLSPQLVRYSLGTGFRADLRVGAAGWAILAEMIEAEVEAILAKPLSGFSEGVTFPADEIRSELESVRKRGYANTQDQRVPDAAGYAAAFYGPDGSVLGSVAVIMPSSRNQTKVRKKLFSDTILRAAKDISSMMGASRITGR